ncbi:DUF2206 domain-containing protein [Methanosphaerula subterraneus]|uniref:DUF2206 domain-containing protein n=1 Tax=Methanosphaerula subterraneus TaxID=3350244 RepID=UPI003F874FD6
MQIKNFFTINDWPIFQFLGTVLGVQCLLWLMLLLDANGTTIPLLRQIVGVVYLLFVPGLLLMRVLKMHRLGSVETLLFTIGLSLVTSMFLGFVMNTIFPVLDVLNPIAEMPLMISLTIFVLIASVLAYLQDRDYADPSTLDTDEIFSLPTVLLSLLPFISIFGTFLMNNEHINLLLVALLLVLALIPVIVGFKSFIPETHYPYAIFMVALALLLHTSLISMHVWGWDINQELYISNLVIQNSAWDFSIYSNINAMLSIVMLVPIFSIIAETSAVWVFKIIYPLIFSLVGLGIYAIAKKQSYNKIAFYASFFFISLFVYYTEMLQVSRQEIAEFFLVLIMLLIINKDLFKIKKYVLLIVFSFALATSHYGLSYMFMLMLFFALLILVISEVGSLGNLRHAIRKQFDWEKRGYAPNFAPRHAGERTVTIDYVMVFAIFALGWYLFISSSSALNSITDLFIQFSNNLVTGFMNSEATQGLSIVVTQATTPLHSIGKYIQFVSQFFIMFGIFSLLFRPQKMELGGEYVAVDREYFSFALVNLVLAVGGVVLPYFSSALNTTRLYQITLICLAPFFVFGVIEMFGVFDRFVRVSWYRFNSENAIKALGAFLCIFLLFNSGVIYTITQDSPTSIALTDSVDYPRFSPLEIAGANWLQQVGNRTIYADIPRATMLEGFSGTLARKMPDQPNLLRKSSYIFFGETNVRTTALTLVNAVTAESVSASALPYIANRGIIYDNGKTRVYT